MIATLISILTFSAAMKAETAAPPVVKVDSFDYAGQTTTAAELCGHIEGTVTGGMQLLVVVDPDQKVPGNYVALPTPQGQFCVVVSTLTGNANVSIVGSGSTIATIRGHAKQ